MKWICFFISVTVGFGSSAQSTAQLDSISGFQSFTLHKKLSALPTNLEFLKVFGNEHAKLFKVTDPVSVNGNSGVVELVFYKDKLVEITVFFEKTSVEDYQRMKRSLTLQFGPAEDQSKNKKAEHLTEDDHTSTWRGKTVGLQLIYDVSHKVTEMIYWGLDATSEKIKAEF